MMRRSLTTILVVAILGLVAMPAARAEDEAQGDSPAEQAYRDAWWAESSAGALDRALDGYRKAVAAEGPAAVRAQALYRMAVVLERIGKTDDAIHALERLAKDFPGETALQAKARDRLEEWTAVDLRTNFEEWYKRYQYSPEFQARIVDLVLKLGSATGDTEATNAAAQELMTIGEAAVPALNAHLRSSNQALRSRAVDLLLALGKYPAARHLVETSSWRRERRGWGALLRAPQDVRERLLTELAELGGDGDDDTQQLRYLLEGKGSWARAVAVSPSSRLPSAMLDADPGATVIHDLVDLVGSLEGPSEQFNSALAAVLFRGGHVPNDVALRWLKLPTVRSRVADWIRRSELRDPDAWRALITAMDNLPVDSQDQSVLFRAFMISLDDVPDDVDLASAVRTYERVAPAGKLNLTATHVSGAGMTGVSFGAVRAPKEIPAVLRFLEAIVDLARDPSVVQRAVQEWSRLHKGDADASRQLLAWARRLASPEVARRAAILAGMQATDETLDSLLEALGSGSPEIDADLLSGLLNNRMLQGLEWGDERILRLHAFARSAEDRTVIKLVGRLFQELHKAPRRVDQLMRLALKVPQRLWIGVTRNLDKTTHVILNRPELLATVRSGFRERWPQWTLEERRSALQFFGALPAPVFGDAELETFLREQLIAQWAARGDEEQETLEQEAKKLILRKLPTVDLDDVRQVFDLSTAEGALAAWGLRRLPFTVEVYDALAAARASPDEDERYSFLNHWMRKAPDEIGHRVAREMTADPDSHVRRVGLEWLAQRRSLDDVRIFEKALTDPDDRVRFSAAEALAGVYDHAAIQALAKALDDPDPEVRDRALETLDAIKKIEEQKDYWKEFAEGRR